MHDARAIPQDLESCQRQLHEAWALHAELSETCTTLQCEEEKLRQENEELQATIKHLLRQLYGRRSERCVEGAGQQHLDFGDDDLSDPSIISAAQQDPVIEEFLVRRRKGGRKPRSERLPDHVERRTERIEPQLPEGIRLEDCELIGVDVVEIPEYQRGKLWVRRVEYPKYKLPSSALSPEVGTQPVAEAACDVIEPVVIEPVVIEPVVIEPVVVDVEITVATEPSEATAPASEAVCVANLEPAVRTADDCQPSNTSPCSSTTDTSSADVPPVVTTKEVAPAPAAR